jgi:hypothetical protein
MTCVLDRAAPHAVWPESNADITPGPPPRRVPAGPRSPGA